MFQLEPLPKLAVVLDKCPNLMSYSLVFSRLTPPQDESQVWQWIDAEIEKYYEDERGVHPRFQKLHDSLTSKYPCICDLPDADIDNGVWSDGPLIDNFAQDIALVAFSVDKTEEILPFILEKATQYGIVVFDHQTSTIYFPE